MLVLTRKPQDSVVVLDGDDCLVKVTVLELSGDRVKLGFEARKELLIHRWEVWERIRAGERPDQPTAEPVAPV